jgi:hypothetical protein
MKFLLYVTLLSCVFFKVSAQQFSFPIIFSDAAGNKDTIILGYDTAATDSIDSAFGEINIISLPLDTGLDVRITNEFYNWNTPGTYHTKKQIVHTTCRYSDLSTIDIYTNHWPVTATWDSSVFNDACRNGSLFTSINPGGWWDTGSPSDLLIAQFKFKDSVTFTSNYTGGGASTAYSYVNIHGDTIPVFWQIFGDSTLILTKVDELQNAGNRMSIFPNPTRSEITIQLPNNFGKINRIEIFSATGDLLITLPSQLNISMYSYPAGLYFIVATNENGNKISTKILRE